MAKFFFRLGWGRLPFSLRCLFLALAPPLLAVAAPPPDYRFQVEVLAEDLTQPMELELGPEGRVFFNEIGGRLRIYHPATRQVTAAGTVPVFTDQENGFLGFALDPGFRTNHWIYLFYSPKEYQGQRLSRFEMRGDLLAPDTEKILLEFSEQRRECCHHAGSVEFGPDGNLYLSTGDNTHPGGDSDGYAPIDERPGQEPYDAQKSSANTHDLRGKILRLRPTPEGKYTVPEGNLFPRDGSQGRPEIFVMGCRNPWRMSIDEQTGYVYWGEVGPDAGGDGPRGSRGYDEINQARRPGNFGWPYFVGNNFAYADHDFETKKNGTRFDPARPLNESPNNTGSRFLPPAQAAFIYWPYGESREFPVLGSGGRTAGAGPVFHFRPSFRDTSGFPEYFDRCLLFFDWQRPFIKWARLDSDSRLVRIEPFTSAVTVLNDPDRARAARARGEWVVQRPIDSQFGADGCLYLLDYGETWGVNRDARLLRISYLWGNVPPIAQASANPSTGREPLTVALSSAGTKDHENDPLQLEWRLHPGGTLFSTNPHPELILKTPGNYVVELRVRDPQGATASAQVPLVIGNTLPHLKFARPQDGDFFVPGQPIHYQVEIVDREDGQSADYDELFDGRTLVQAEWTRADGKTSDDESGLALMKQSDCFNCHQIEQKVVGPPLLEVAQRYRQQPEAVSNSVARVLKGSTGVWSDVPMLPHASLSPAHVRQMVEWIYRLEPGVRSANVTRGLAGTVIPPKDTTLQLVTLSASYTDRGREGAGSLTAETKVALRPRRLQAELADEKSGLKTLGTFLGSIDHGHFARFDRLSLADTRNVVVNIASAGAGGRIELRAGTLNGPILAAIDVAPTGAWDRWKELPTSLSSPPVGKTAVYVVFINPGKTALMNLDWIEFQSHAPITNSPPASDPAP